jgi:hypothetical protein
MLGSSGEAEQLATSQKEYTSMVSGGQLVSWLFSSLVGWFVSYVLMGTGLGRILWGDACERERT